MNTAIAKLLSQTYEIEGLLLVADKHGADTPAMVFDMIRTKTAQLHDMAQLLETPPAKPDDIPQATAQPQVEEPPMPPIEEPPMPPVEEPPMPPVEEATMPQVEELAHENIDSESSLPADDYDKEDTWQHDNGEEFKEILGGFDYEEPKHTNLDETPAAEQDDEEDEEPPVFVKMKLDEDKDEQTDVRIDEQLHRNLSKNLRKAFSLNDHFRFRRELFANSDAELNDTLNLVETMKSYQEAEEYFYNDMGWDADNEDVADFMAIIKKHFL